MAHIPAHQRYVKAAPASDSPAMPGATSNPPKTKGTGPSPAQEAARKKFIAMVEAKRKNAAPANG